MREIEIKYKELCLKPSDINEHLPTLREYGEKCEHITEFGVRYIVSTYAFLAAKPKKLISYDINPCNWEPLRDLVKNHTEFIFKQEDVLKTNIEPTDLLFIDTLHNYSQLKEELRLHSDKVSKYIILHDTETFGIRGETEDNGLLIAVGEFLERNKSWKIEKVYRNNNGLMILSKI